MLQDTITKMTEYIFKHRKSFCDYVIRKDVLIRDMSFSGAGIAVFYEHEGRVFTELFDWHKLNSWLYVNEKEIAKGI